MEEINDAIKFTQRIHSVVFESQKTVKIMAIACVAIVVGVVALTYYREYKMRDVIYVLDEGAVLSAYRSDNGVQVDLEIMNHMYRFHELFFNVVPNQEMYVKNVERAMELADESAYDYYCDLQEKQYFTKIAGTGAFQEIQVDSVLTDITRYPYPVITFAHVYVQRESSITEYTLRTECQVHEVSRSPKNPHGLMIEKFWVPEFKMTETRNR